MHQVRAPKPEPRSEEPNLAGAQMVLLGLLVPVAFGRWGSYIGLPGSPVFLSDVLYIGGLLLLIGGGLKLTLRSQFGFSRLPTAAFLGCILIGILGAEGDLITIARDAAPFAYLASIPIATAALALIDRATVRRWITNACLVHSAWFTTATFGLLAPISSGVVGSPIFSTRGDFDVLVAGLTIIFVCQDPRFTAATKVFLCAASGAPALLSGSRAGLIAAVLAILIAAATSRFWRQPKAGPALVAIAFLSSTVVLIAATQVLTNPPQWAVGLQKLVPSGSSAYATGQNTWEARRQAWSHVITYVNAGPTDGSSLFGTGFGSQPVLRSGAVDFLSGDPAVRSAHNFLVTWYGFIGPIGAGLAGLGIIVLLCGAYRRVGFNSAAAPALAGLAGLVLTAMAGVILESPFGYMTFVLLISLCFVHTPRPQETHGAIIRHTVTEPDGRIS